MITITKVKNPKKYQIPEMPNFENRRAKVVWLRKQKELVSLPNIKSVSVQVKDIKQMIYSKNPRLISLYAKFHLNNVDSSYSDNDYITILKSSNLNKSLIYALISAEWLLDFEYIEKQPLEEIQQESLDLQNKIFKLYERRKQMINHGDIDFKIKLLEYKLSCLSEFTLNKVEAERNLVQSKIERVLSKGKK